jgi:hypothetical protein
VGEAVGTSVGVLVVGAASRSLRRGSGQTEASYVPADGREDGELLGSAVGDSVGEAVVGSAEGAAEGAAVGALDGNAVGPSVRGALAKHSGRGARLA